MKKITIPKEIFFSGIVIGISIMLIPFFVLADEGHDEVVPHGDSTEVQGVSAESEVFEVGVEEAKAAKGSSPDTSEEVSREEDIEHGIGDGHTDHTHIVLPTIWWQSTMWWVLFLISLFLMAILSYGVYKYLENKK